LSVTVTSRLLRTLPPVADYYYDGLLPPGFRFASDGARGRIAIGGFQHETNVFSSSQAAYADFVAGGSYPGLSRGAEMLRTMRSTSLPIAGFIRSAAEVTVTDGHGRLWTVTADERLFLI
jgi:hypothetical protein